MTGFVAPRGVMINAAYIENGVGGISFLLATIIGGENIYRNVRQQSSIMGKTQTPTVIPSSIVGDNWKGWRF